MKPFRFRMGSRLGLVACCCCSIAAIPVLAHSTETKPHKAHFYYLRGVRMGSFALGTDAQIQLGTNHTAALGSLAVGQTAHLSYTIENGLLIAHQITVNLPHEKPAKSAEPATSPAANHPETQPQEHHVHGVIAGINTAAGTITLRNPR